VALEKKRIPIYFEKEALGEKIEKEDVFLSLSKEKGERLPPWVGRGKKAAMPACSEKGGKKKKERHQHCPGGKTPQSPN